MVVVVVMMMKKKKKKKKKKKVMVVVTMMVMKMMMMMEEVVVVVVMKKEAWGARDPGAKSALRASVVGWSRGGAPPLLQEPGAPWAPAPACPLRSGSAP